MTLPPAPLVDSGQLVDAGNLATLKRAAANGNPQALRAAARQFESLFVSMVLKSMQQASFKDPLFGSDQGDLYQEMYDDQLAAEMSQGKGLGLADMLVQQLRRGAMGATDSTRTTQPGPGSTARAGAAITSGSGPAASASACPSGTQQTKFARTLWPDAQRAARELGVNPVTLLAQAALETHWGRSVPQDASGGTSNNLFGIKASPGWRGPAVTSSTQEYSGGTASTVKARFRSYASAGECFQDYVELLKSNPRYAAALGAGNDVQAFGSALQQGGYATDPAYAGKLTAVAGTLTRALTRDLASAVAPGAVAGAAPGSSAPLKFAARRPTTDGSGPL